jgi:NTE family protein
VTTDTRSAKRVVFGREGSPEAELSKAVAASCAIPGFYRPVRIGDRHYVDGGVCSASNLDLLKDAGLDLIVCLNPTSTRAKVPARTPAAIVAGQMRAGAGRRVGSEAKKVRAAGTEVLLIQPDADDLAVMGTNLMSGRRRHEVIETAIETVGRQLEAPEADELLTGLPAGEPHKVRRPAGPPASWPPIVSSSQREAA